LEAIKTSARFGAEKLFKYPYYEVLREDVELPALYHDSYRVSQRELTELPPRNNGFCLSTLIKRSI